MLRVRALFLLGMFVVNQAACYSWQAPKVSPQAYAAQHPYKDIRILPKNEHGDPNLEAAVVLRDVRFSGDSVFGRDPNGRSLAFGIQHVAAMEVRGMDGVRTGLAVLLVPTFVVGATLVVTYLFGCAMFGSSASLGGVSC